MVGRYITLTTYNLFYTLQRTIVNSRGVCSSATTEIRHVILDFNMVSEVITFEPKSSFGKEKHQNLGVKVKVIA